MRIRRTTSPLLVVLGVLVMVLAGCSFGDGDDAQETPAADSSKDAGATKRSGLLMVQESRSGTLRERADTGDYTLTLRNPSRFVTVFTDRPQRRAWRVEAQRFVQSWDAYGFEQDPPNAALEVPNAPPGRDLVIVELSDPTLDDSGDLTYTVRQGSKQRSGGAAFQRPTAELRASSFEHPTLFIDSGSSPSPDAWTQACEMERGRSDTSGYIWHCTWGNRLDKPDDAIQVMAGTCPGSFNYDQNRDASCIT